MSSAAFILHWTMCHAAPAPASLHVGVGEHCISMSPFVLDSEKECQEIGAYIDGLWRDEYFPIWGCEAVRK